MLGSGVEETIAMSTGFGTATSEAFTVAPKVVYSPIVEETAVWVTTNRSDPDTTMLTGVFNP